MKRYLRELTPPVVWRSVSRLIQLGYSSSQPRNIETLTELSPFTSKYMTGRVGFSIARKKLRYFGGVAFTPQQHHFLKYYEHGELALKTYYENHQPKNIFEKHFLKNEKQIGCERNLPWLDVDRSQERGEGGLNLSEGIQHYGPVSERKLMYEVQRLSKVRGSIAKNGFIASLGLPRGYCLLKNLEDWVFIIVGGQHRVAAMVQEGYAQIPVCFQPNYPRVVVKSDVLNWPSVTSGELRVDQAERIFDSYFRSTENQLVPYN